MPPRTPRRRPALLAREPAEGVRLVAQQLLAQAGAAASRLADPGDAEALHDFRVAVRRLRSWLRSFSPLVKDTLRKRWRKALKELAGATSAARDAEVMQAWVLRARGELPPHHRHAAEAFAAGVAPASDEADPRTAAAAALARLAPHLEEALTRYARRVGDARRGRFGDAWAAAVHDQLAALDAALREVAAPEDVDPAHRARIEGKRLRYLLEPLRAVVPQARPAVGTLKALQDLLGELHDVHVLGARLAEARAQAAADGARAEHRALHAGGEGQARAVARRSAGPGLAALDRRARAQGDALFQTLAREWLGDGARTRELRRDVERVAAAVASTRRGTRAPAKRRR